MLRCGKQHAIAKLSRTIKLHEHVGKQTCELWTCVWLPGYMLLSYQCNYTDLKLKPSQVCDTYTWCDLFSFHQIHVQAFCLWKQKPQTTWLACLKINIVFLTVCDGIGMGYTATIHWRSEESSSTCSGPNLSKLLGALVRQLQLGVPTLQGKTWHKATAQLCKPNCLYMGGVRGCGAAALGLWRA